MNSTKKVINLTKYSNKKNHREENMLVVTERSKKDLGRREIVNCDVDEIVRRL